MCPRVSVCSVCVSCPFISQLSRRWRRQLLLSHLPFSLNLSWSGGRSCSPSAHPAHFPFLLSSFNSCPLRAIFPSSGQVRREAEEGGAAGGGGAVSALLSGASRNCISQQREEGLVVIWAFLIVRSTQRSILWSELDMSKHDTPTVPFPWQI